MSISNDGWSPASVLAELDLAQADVGRAGAEKAALLARLAETSPAELARLRDRLTAAATRDGLLDVAYRTVDTPVGSLLLAATSEGLVRVAFGREDHAAVLDELARRVSPRILRAPGRLDDAARQLDQYFAGQRRSFGLALDFRLARGFRLDVLHQLPGIGYGATASYAAVAALAGRPQAVRAAASACATNPLPVVVPCHRVVRADGSPGGYLGGPQAKRTLLALEAGTGLSPVPD